MRFTSLISLLVVLFSPIALADESYEVRMPGQMQTGSLLLRMQAGYRVATSLNTDVDIKINGMVARVAVRQEFHNTGADWAEGVYVFPLPDKAAVDRLRLHIGERFIEGEIREKEQARKEYEQARAAGKKASLVEQQRPNLFTTSVANIAPGEKVIVEIEYLEDLIYKDEVFSLRFPMTITPRYMPGSPLPDRQGSGWSPDTSSVPDASLISPPMIGRLAAHRVTLRASVNAGLPLDLIASRYHPVNIRENGSHYELELTGKDVPLDHDFELLWRPDAGSEPQAMVFAETIDDEPYFLLMVMPPTEQSESVVTMPREMIFIIDTSGSMHGTSITQAKQALRRALDGLQPSDRFNVIAFSSHATPLFPASVDVNTTRLADAQRFVASLGANGGTEMRAALQLALKAPPEETHLRQIVFITDGAVGNEDELFQLIEQRLGSGRLFTVGIGSAPNSWFMRKAAESGRGTFTTISALNEVGEKMDRLFEKIERPQVTNIQVEWPSGVSVDAYPGVIPDLYVNEPVTVRARVTGPLGPGDQVHVHGDSAGGAWSSSLRLQHDLQSAGIGALWARARIGDLEDQGRRGRDADQVRDAIVVTALRHHLVSRHTSLVAVDKTPERTAAELLRRDQVPNLMAYGQSSNAIFGFPTTATNAAQLMHIGAAFVAVAMLLFVLGRTRPETTRVWRH